MKKRKNLQQKKDLLGIIFVMPAVLTALVFIYYPFVKAFYMSMFDYDIVKQGGKFLGLGNFSTLFTRDIYWLAWANTLILFLYSIILGFWIPIFQAIMLYFISKLQKMYRLMYILPSIVPGVATILMWKWIFEPGSGLLNEVIGIFGLGPFNWIYDPSMAKLSMGLMGVLGGGFSVLIYLATIQGISQEQFESAEIDGATGRKKIFRIILPQMRNIILIQLIFGVIGGMQAFSTQFVMTEGGPVNSTLVLNLLIFQSGFRDMRYGFACAISITMFIVIFILTRVQIRVQHILEE